MSEAVRLDNELKKTAGMSPQVSVILKESRDREWRAVLPVFAIYRRSGEEHTGCMDWKTRGQSFLSDGYVPTSMSVPETNMILGATWNIRAQLVIEAAEDLRNDGRATYVSRELDQIGQVVKEGECWELQKGKGGAATGF